MYEKKKLVLMRIEKERLTLKVFESKTANGSDGAGPLLR